MLPHQHDWVQVFLETEEEYAARRGEAGLETDVAYCTAYPSGRLFEYRCSSCGQRKPDHIQWDWVNRGWYDENTHWAIGHPMTPEEIREREEDD